MAKQVYVDLKDTANFEEMLEELCCGNIRSIDDKYDYFEMVTAKLNTKEGQEQYNNYIELKNKDRKKYLQEFIGENTNKQFFIFEYSDNDGRFYTTLEHGNLFKNLEHLRISKH